MAKMAKINNITTDSNIGINAFILIRKINKKIKNSSGRYWRLVQKK